MTRQIKIGNLRHIFLECDLRTFVEI